MRPRKESGCAAGGVWVAPPKPDEPSLDVARLSRLTLRYAALVVRVTLS